MADLIDRQELISWLSKDPLFPQVESFGLTNVIESRPSVDAVPVVRCKDCIHSATCTKEIIMRKRIGSYIYCPMGDEGFCSHGERREDAKTN